MWQSKPHDTGTVIDSPTATWLDIRNSQLVKSADYDSYRDAYTRELQARLPGYHSQRALMAVLADALCSGCRTKTAQREGWAARGLSLDWAYECSLHPNRISELLLPLLQISVYSATDQFCHRSARHARKRLQASHLLNPQKEAGLLHIWFLRHALYVHHSATTCQ
jgi:hypothetical protein